MSKCLIVVGGGLKTSIKTRWSTILDCLDSVARLGNKYSLRGKILSMSLVFLIKLGLYHLFLKAKNATIVDCFIQIARLTSQIKYLSTTVDPNFKNYCITV